jgi:hypothetical protein
MYSTEDVINLQQLSQVTSGLFVPEEKDLKNNKKDEMNLELNYFQCFPAFPVTADHDNEWKEEEIFVDEDAEDGSEDEGKARKAIVNENESESASQKDSNENNLEARINRIRKENQAKAPSRQTVKENLDEVYWKNIYDITPKQFHIYCLNSKDSSSAEKKEKNPVIRYTLSLPSYSIPLDHMMSSLLTNENRPDLNPMENSKEYQFPEVLPSMINPVMITKNTEVSYLPYLQSAYEVSDSVFLLISLLFL